MLLDRLNKTSWVFPALKSTSHFLPQSTVACKSNSSSKVNSSCCHRFKFSSSCFLRIESRIISTDSNITDTLMYGRKSVGPKMEPSKTLKKLTLFFLSNPVLFNEQSYQKGKGLELVTSHSSGSKTSSQKFIY